MGRLTWEALPAGGAGFEGKDIVVVSRTLQPDEHDDITIWPDDLKMRVSSLRAQSGKDIWLFGGGGLFRSLLELGLVDTVEVAVVDAPGDAGAFSIRAPGV